MNEHDLDAGLHAIRLERTTYPDVADVHAQLLAIPIDQIPQQRGFLPPLTGRFQSMFSATKFVVAGAVVALFGGFLLAGVLTTQQNDETVPAVGASASSSARPDTTAQPTTTRTDILPGVSLLTQEVEPGILRILGDDAGHDLTEGHPDAVPELLDIAISPDGTPWIADSDDLGDEVRVWALGHRGEYHVANGLGDFSVLLAEPDGTITAVSGNGILSFDGEGFTPNPGSRQWEASDGLLWIVDRDTLMDASGAQGGARSSSADPGALALFWPRFQGATLPAYGGGRWHVVRDRGSFLQLPGDQPGGTFWAISEIHEHVHIDGSEHAGPEDGVVFYKSGSDVQFHAASAAYLGDTAIDKITLAPDGSIWAIGDWAIGEGEETIGLYRIDPAEVAKP